jgi:hypothetical protein
LQKVGGGAPPFWKGLRGPGGRPDPQNGDFRPLNIVKNPPKVTPRRPKRFLYQSPYRSTKTKQAGQSDRKFYENG